MNNLTIGDIVENSIHQHSIVRWQGSVNEIAVIGLESLRSQLPGFTDGTCSLNNQRYFQCPDRHGYYVLENNFFKTHRIIEKKKETKNEFERQSSESPQPISPASSPSIAQQHSNNHDTSPSRGILTRLSFKQQSQESRAYRPDNYQSVSCSQTRRSIISPFDSNEENTISDAPSSERNHNLNGWTLAQLNDFMDKQIPEDNRLCLNISEDHCDVMNLIDEQINCYISNQPKKPLDNIHIELIKLFGYVEVIFPSSTIRLHKNNYLLLAVICSNNQSAYIRTSNGWAYIDTERDNERSIIVNEISQMIDNNNRNLLNQSEQCRHLVKDASFLYYKRI